MAEAIRIDGLKQFRTNLRQMDRDLPKALRLAFNQAAQIVVDDAKPRVPVRSGTAAGSIKTKSTQKFVQIKAGGNRAPYYPFLDFGGSVGRNNSVKRPFFKDGRYIYRSYFDNREKFLEVLQDSIVKVATDAGIEVD